MSKTCTQKVYAYWRECDHLTLDLGGSCPVCAKIEKRVTAARVDELTEAGIIVMAGYDEKLKSHRLLAVIAAVIKRRIAELEAE